MGDQRSRELPPSGAGQFTAAYPQVWDTNAALGKASAEAGPLDAATAGELRQVAILAITTLGFPRAMAGYSWINDISDETESAASSIAEAKATHDVRRPKAIEVRR